MKKSIFDLENYKLKNLIAVTGGNGNDGDDGGTTDKDKSIRPPTNGTSSSGN